MDIIWYDLRLQQDYRPLAFPLGEYTRVRVRRAGLDDCDKAIIERLKLEPRIPIKRLAEELEIDRKECDRRFKRLLEENFVNIIAAVVSEQDKEIPQNCSYVLIKLRSTSISSMNSVQNFIINEENITWAARLAGNQWDYMIKMESRNTEEFDDIIVSLNEIDAVKLTWTILVLRIILY